ncbi:potassium transporter TrkG [uncultured Anaerovibrio sp.]|uniref:potassium transporter TrkG n=1 Tax=uncultured Anaerovibrio sp. TaxID=361586 RepID=UPI00261F7830|nr:potassium transporter TrkG [uncultured Anaerovibrio sp.]
MDRLILYLISKALFNCAGLMLIPFIYSISIGTYDTTGVFGKAIFIILLTGIFIRRKSAQHGDSLSVTGGAAFLFVVWTALAMAGALPYYIGEQLDGPSAFMESLSGFTTTGYTNLLDLKEPSLVLWRSLTQWIGGGLVLMFIATILPAVNGLFGISFAMPVALRTGVISLKRIKDTIRRLMLIYSLITLIGILCFYMAGLEVYDAVNYSLVIISTGGCYFSDTYLYDDFWFAVFVTLGLIAAGCNIMIYWQALKTKKTALLRKNLQNSESQIFILMILLLGLIIGAHLCYSSYYNLIDSLWYGFLGVAMYAGTISAYPMEILSWPDFDKLILIIVACVGGCIGSLAGGFKILRLMILFKSCSHELTRTIHPDIVMTTKIDGRIVPPALINRIFGLFFIVLISVSLSIVVVSTAGLSMQQATDIVIGCITSTGAIMYFHTGTAILFSLPVYIKLFCCFLMVLGKIDFFAFLLLIYSFRDHLLNERW